MKRQWVVQAAHVLIAVLTSAALALLAEIGARYRLPIADPDYASSMLGGTFAFYAPVTHGACCRTWCRMTMVFNATTLSYSGTRLMGFFGPVLAGYLLQFDRADFCHLPDGADGALRASGPRIYSQGHAFFAADQKAQDGEARGSFPAADMAM